MSRTFTRLYDGYPDAQTAAGGLESLGVPRSDISIVANNVDRAHDDHGRIGGDAGTGARVGAAVGGVGGLLVGLGMLSVPGLGPVVAAGWLASTMLGAGAGLIAGGAFGGLLGALLDEGVSEEDAHVYSEGVRRGGTLVSAKVSDALAMAAEAEMDRAGAVDPAERGRDYRDGGWTGFDADAAAQSPEQIEQERARRRRVDVSL